MRGNFIEQNKSVRMVSKLNIRSHTVRDNSKYGVRGQVWIETVIYTLIGLAVIGLLLAVARPKISEMKDKLVIEQSMAAMGNINDKIYEVQRAPGNQRTVDLEVGKGKFVIDSDGDRIYWIIDSSYEFSEPGINISLGAMKVRTEVDNPWRVLLEIGYGVNITYNGVDNGVKELTPAAVPYQVYIRNLGNINGNLVVDLTAV